MMNRITLAVCFLLLGSIQVGSTLDYEVNEETANSGIFSQSLPVLLHNIDHKRHSRKLKAKCHWQHVARCQLLIDSIKHRSTEPIQPNRLDEASSNFQCSSDGYFADIAYGCQFYHICENSNNPYDKPTFVKHTFSCVNGTVFNQMSFTCTRYEDSIPCEASPNYFYLNKRNGDPKAVFLTEEDMVKPVANKHSPTLSASSNFLAAPAPVMFPSKPSRQEKPVDRQYELNFRDLSDSSTSSSNIINNAKLEAAMKKQRESNFLSVGDSSYGSNSLITTNAYSRQLQQESPEKHQRESPSAPYDIAHKYFPSNIKPGVRYSNVNMNSEKSRQFNQSSGKSNDVFRSLLNGYTPSNSKIDQLLVNNDNVLDEHPKNSYLFSNSYQQNENPEFAITPSSFKKSSFTPSTFSKMYIESQKSSRYNQPVGRAVSTTEDSRLAFNKFSEKPKPQYLKQDMIIPRNNLQMYENISNKMSPSKTKSAVPLPKYSQAKSESSGDYQELKSSQYVVPSSIRIIEQGGRQAKPSPPKVLNHNSPQSPVINHIAGYQVPSTNRLQSEPQLSNLNQPVKIAFISDNTNGEQVSDYGNYKVIKEVKGKNLLIDPSLENDPARDNIIAQVLEMLSKYN